MRPGSFTKNSHLDAQTHLLSVTFVEIALSCLFGATRFKRIRHSDMGDH
jgi:hypothetical protein